MIRFLFSAGTCACHELLKQSIEHDLAAGDEVILLMPEQETVVAERRWLKELDAAAQLSFEVSNFTRLANRIFRTEGGLSYRYASEGISALLMWRTLKSLAPALKHYTEYAANDTGLVDRMLSAVAQFKAYCVSPAALAEVADELDPKGPLKAKLADLALVYATYQKELSLQFDDMADDLTRATALLREHRSHYKDFHIYIDSFTDFTKQEKELILALLGTVKSLTVTSPLTAPHSKGIHLASARATLLDLEKAARERGIPVTYEKPTAKKPETALAYLARDLFDLQAEPLPLGLATSGEVTLTLAATPFEEAEFAASTVAALVQGGCRYRDIAVVVRDQSAYNGIIDAVFEKENIPFYISEKTDITVRPLIKLILFALRIKRFGWRREDVVGYLKTGLCGIDADKINFFEEYAEIWHLQGAEVYLSPFTMSADGYRDQSERAAARGKRILAGANRVREALLPPLSALFAALDEAVDAADTCRALYDFLLGLGVPDAMKARADKLLLAGERREAEEATRLWGVLVDALDAIAATGGEKPQIDDLITALRLVFARTDIGAIPTSADEVMIGSAATLRAEPVPYVIVLGLNEGLFPKTVKEDGLLSDAEKKRLREFQIELSAESDVVASDELFYVARTFALPTKKLILSYSETAGDGRHAEPSIAILRVQALFKNLEKPPLYASLPASERIFSRAAALEHLLELDGVTREALLSLLLRDKEAVEKIKHLQIPMSDPDAAVSTESAANLFRETAALAPTRLEKFVSCQFAYYCRYILGLREEPSDTLDSAAVGTFIHYVLEKTFTILKKDGKPASALSPDERDRIVTDSIAAYRAHLIEIGGGISPRAEALLTRLSALAKIVVGALLAELADSLFCPAFLELDLGKTGGEAALALQGGKKLPITGKIDRVDYYQAKDGRVYLRITDYKTGKKTFKREEISEGFGLQMPLYLYALCHGKHEKLQTELPATTLYPAGVTYISTAISTDTTSSRISFEEARKKAASRLGREGLLPADEELLEAVSLSGDKDILPKRMPRTTADDFKGLFHDLEDTVSRIAREMRSGGAAARPKRQSKKSPCNYCAFAPVCRAADKDKFQGD